MRLRRDQDQKKQPESSANPHTMEFPPPGQLRNDNVPKTSQLLPTPDKPSATLPKSEAKGKIKFDQLSPLQVPCPLNHLFAKIDLFFADGTQTASIRFAAIQATVTEGEAEVTHSSCQVASRTLAGNSLPWNSCKLAATLVLLHAVPTDAQVMFEALKFQSQSLGGLQTMSTISGAPSASLASRFAQAKKAAVDGKVGTCTVLAVSLVDVEMIERGESRSKPMSWGEHGYTLDEYLERDGARPGDWKEAKAFLKAFLVLATAEGSWSQKINDAYEACFEVNIFKVCGEKSPQTPIVPIYRPWVRFFEVEDVKDSDIEKFAWDSHSKKVLASEVA
ncbi:MAG: hypothetical protein ALECFALPRED_008680 [Alectoria fallacina]|uniref:Uncharacterized protein n=1 Tax=Alectoria fallacina TaxID=1903189 RepID=A0A8H3PGZ4_9LECA|nr:MAG: hypothetical protein ALECFALPRED_008680 [Alectoria fallacina]